MPVPNAERQQLVLDILHDLKGVEKLKKLFWSELNYEHVNRPIPRRGWGEQASKALVDDPTLFATGAKDFQVIHARLNSEKLLMAMERPVVSRMLQDHPYALFVFSNRTEDRWHFLNVKYDDEVQKRRIFRRITVGPEEQLRTASERISMLDLESISPDLFGLSPLAIQERHDEAFDVEPVTQEFFHEYRRVFEEVEATIKGIRDKERKRLFTQRLFNRLMFVAFIQKKGWLELDGDRGYLPALWKAHVKDKTSNKNFYRDRLKSLFFMGLNTSNEVDIININRGRNRGAGLASLIGQVPYLNGGLFEEDEDDKNEAIEVPDKAAHAILDDLFSRFNFTVTESTPLDMEVAVDPEMLGKIFEELVTGRHETGSYYTPKPVVSFMCREALKGYLETQLPSESNTAVEQFIEEHDPAKIRDAEAALDALRRITVCDPACGSGAYLLGMLHELLDLRAALFATKKLDAPSVFERKLEIIQRNLYGVDVDPFAVNIARLRLWLSLAVEFEGNDPPPLPNLDYKVEAGDSLAAPDPSGGMEHQGLLRKSSIEEFLRLKGQYLTAHGGAKVELRRKIEAARDNIAGWAHGHGAAEGFDWPVEFAEVFFGGGFDVVLANPPYVRMELFKEIKPVLRKNFPRVHAERADLYCYFYARALELLKSSGMFVFISSNKWLRAAYGANLRKHMASTCMVKSITDFGDLPVFQSATSYPMILVARKLQGESTPILTQVNSLEPPYPDVLALIRLHGEQVPPEALHGSQWTLSCAESVALVHAAQSSGVLLTEYVGAPVCRGIVSGLTDAFVIDGRVRSELITANENCKAWVKPYLMGKDIRRWATPSTKRWLLFVPHGSDLSDCREILGHLRPFKQQLEHRATKQEWYELQQPQEKFVPVFEHAKIMFPDIAKEPRFTLDKNRHYFGNTVYAIPTDDLYLLGVLNSSTVEALYRTVSAQIRGGYLRFFAHYIERIPVPKASRSDKTTIAALAEQCLDRRGQKCADLEVEINARVARLYGMPR